MSKLSKEEKSDMVYTINDMLRKRDSEGNYCNHEGCMNCVCIEDCYSAACVVENTGFASAIGYGGYDSDDEFWEQI